MTTSPTSSPTARQPWLPLPSWHYGASPAPPNKIFLHQKVQLLRYLHNFPIASGWNDRCRVGIAHPMRASSRDELMTDGPALDRLRYWQFYFTPLRLVDGVHGPVELRTEFLISCLVVWEIPRHVVVGPGEGRAR